MKYVIFDIDGTLNRTDLYAVEAYKRAIEKRNRRTTREEILSCIGLSPAAIVERLFGRLEQEELESWETDIREFETELMKGNARPFDGVEQSLDALKREGYGLAICSNAFLAHIDRVLAGIGLSDYFDVIGCLDMGADKTEIVGKLLAGPDWDQACMVGDRIFDIQAARANGIPMIGCAYGYAPEEIAGADIVVADALDLFGAVKALL